MTQNSAHEYLDQRPNVGWRMIAPSPGTTRQGFSFGLRILLPPVASSADFPVRLNLAPEGSAAPSTDWLLTLAEQRRHRRLLKKGHDGPIQILEDRTPLLRTR